jgi:hypothetical protein
LLLSAACDNESKNPPQCTSSADCASREDGKTVCNTVEGICEEPEAECQSDDDCKDRVDAKTVCDVQNGLCIEPSVEPRCGDGIKNGTELCDGSDLGEATCQSAYPERFVGGDLRCNEKCEFSLDSCLECTLADTRYCDEGQECSENGICVEAKPFCGDKKLNQDDEECEPALAISKTCAEIDSSAYVDGNPSCNKSCKWDLSACKQCTSQDSSKCKTNEECNNSGICVPKGYTQSCGDSIVNKPDEECDSNNLDGKSCADMAGFAAGVLSCSNECKFNTSACLECNSDVHCKDRTDGKHKCDTSQNLCVIPPKPECELDNPCKSEQDYCKVNAVDPLKNTCVKRSQCLANGCTSVGNQDGLCAGVAWNTDGSFTPCEHGCEANQCKSAPLIWADIVISQLYSGGALASSTFKSKYVELFNRSEKDLVLHNWSLQYASASGDKIAYVCSIPKIEIKAKQYFLVDIRSTSSGNATLSPKADYTCEKTISAATESGKMILVNHSTALDSAMPSKDSFIDALGYGAANWGEGGAATGQKLTKTTAAW